MGIFDGCLLACDVDGTLMNNNYINPKNIEKIKFFEREGGKFVISTGRGVVALGPVLEQMPDISLAVVANGCIIYDYKNSDVLYENEILREEYSYAQFICDLGFDVGAEIHCGDKAYTLKRNNATTLHQEYEEYEAEDVSFEFVSQKKWNKAIFLFELAEDREKTKAELAKRKTECLFINTCAVIDGKVQNYLEQVPRGVSKATALKELCKILNTDKGNLFAIGDYYNDMEMLKLSDICAAPNDSPEEVKEIADYLTCTCADGAVADFIDYLTDRFNALCI